MSKICFFAPNLNGGGAERIISVLANHLSGKGMAVDLVLATATGPYLEGIAKEVSVVDLQSRRVSFAIFKLVNYLRKHKPSVVFASQMHASRALIIAVKLSGIQCKIIVRQPTMLISPYEPRSWKGLLNLKLFLLLVRRFVDKVILTNQAMADEFAQLSKIESSKLQVIYNPLPIGLIQQKSKAPLAHPWFEEGQPPVVLAVGRLEKVKNFPSLIKAFSTVVKETNARLVILGEGSERNALEQLVSELGLQNHIQMPGFVENPYQYMARAKVFVQSSIREGFSNGLIEAMACGTSIVATDCVGGTAEILGDGAWGCLVEVNNSAALARALIQEVDSQHSKNTAKRAFDFDSSSFFVEFQSMLDSI